MSKSVQVPGHQLLEGRQTRSAYIDHHVLPADMPLEAKLSNLSAETMIKFF